MSTAACTALPHKDGLALIEAHDPHEWWVTINGRRMVGFGGDAAHERAQRYFADLWDIATPASPSEDDVKL